MSLKSDCLQWENNYQVLDWPPNYEGSMKREYFSFYPVPAHRKLREKNVSKIHKRYRRPAGYWEFTGASSRIKSCGWIISWPLKYSAAIIHSHDSECKMISCRCQAGTFPFCWCSHCKLHSCSTKPLHAQSELVRHVLSWAARCYPLAPWNKWCSLIWHHEARSSNYLQRVLRK